MKFASVECPMEKLDDGRWFIADRTVVKQPHVKAFVARLSNYWSRDYLRCGWVSPTNSET